ncbi:MAG TPA: hypothetical protein VMT17_10220 [Anaeromyxobacteraceae bacterium]|nr:hypothetical protein [Anaeromyxobacteraceae bacterium]
MKARVLGFAIVGLLAFGLAATGCGGSSSSGGGSTSSCTLPAAEGICLQFSISGLTGTQVGEVQNACSSNGLTYANSPCSTTGTVPGYCSIPASTIGGYLPGGAITTAEAYFLSSVYSSSAATGFCTSELNGSWVTP